MAERLGFYITKGGFIPYIDGADRKDIETKIKENDFDELESRMEFTHSEFDTWDES
jgi:hypothetical protein